MAGRFTIEAVFKAIDKVTAPVSRMQNNVLKMTRKTRQGFMALNRSVSNVAGGMKRAAVGMAASLAIVAFAMKRIIETGAEFELNIIRAAAKFPTAIRKGTNEFIVLSGEVRKLAATTEFTASQSAEALNTLATAGFNAKEAIGALPVVMNLATAAQVDLSEATRMSVKVAGALNLPFKTLEQRMKSMTIASDLLAKGANSSTTTIEDLFMAISRGGGAARVAGASMVDIVTILGALADSAVDAQKAGTALKRISLAISNPGKVTEAAKAFKFLKVQTTETVNGVKKIRNIIDVFKDLNKAIKGLDPAKRPVIIEAIFGKISVDAAAKLMARTGSGIDDLRERIKNFKGTTKSQAEIIRESTLIKMRIFASAIEEVKLKLFDLVQGPFLNVLKITTAWITKNDDMIKGLAPFMPLILGISAGLLVLFGVFVSLTVAVIAFGFVMSAVTAILASPVIAGVIAVLLVLAGTYVIVIAILITFATIIFKFTNEWLNMIDNLKKSDSIWAKLFVFVTSIVSVFTELKEILDQVGDVFANKIAKGLLKVQTAMENIKDLARFIPDVFGFGGPELRGDEVGSAGDIGRGERQFDDEQSNIVSQAERTKAAILFGLKDTAINRSEVTIKDDTGRAEVTGGKLGNGLSLESSGGYN